MEAQSPVQPAGFALEHTLRLHWGLWRVLGGAFLHATLCGPCTQLSRPAVFLNINTECGRAHSDRLCSLLGRQLSLLENTGWFLQVRLTASSDQHVDRERQLLKRPWSTMLVPQGVLHGWATCAVGSAHI